MRAIVFVNGQFEDRDQVAQLLRDDDYWVAADGGALHCARGDIVVSGNRISGEGSRLLCGGSVRAKVVHGATIDARGEEVRIYRGAEFGGQPEVTMRMSADFAHAFWNGRVNLVSALTRRQVIAKGNVPKTLKLLPILKPAYALYPQYLAEIGMKEAA